MSSLFIGFVSRPTAVRPVRYFTLKRLGRLRRLRTLWKLRKLKKRLPFGQLIVYQENDNLDNEIASMKLSVTEMETLTELLIIPVSQLVAI